MANNKNIMENRRELVKSELASFLEMQGFDVSVGKTFINAVCGNEYEVSVYVNSMVIVDVHRIVSGNVSISKHFHLEKMAIKTSEAIKKFIIAAIKFIIREGM